MKPPHVGMQIKNILVMKLTNMFVVMKLAPANIVKSHAKKALSIAHNIPPLRKSTFEKGGAKPTFEKGGAKPTFEKVHL